MNIFFVFYTNDVYNFSFRSEHFRVRRQPVDERGGQTPEVFLGARPQSNLQPAGTENKAPSSDRFFQSNFAVVYKNVNHTRFYKLCL